MAQHSSMDAHLSLHGRKNNALAGDSQDMPVILWHYFFSFRGL
jgi:hypothetical protein